MITDIDSFSMCVNFKLVLLVSCIFTRIEFIAIWTWHMEKCGDVGFLN